MLDLDQAIGERHSTRMFLSRPVPHALMDEALALAQYAPSNSNTQPWHVVFASGAARDRFVAALVDAARSRPPNIPPLPEGFQHYRHELGAQVYGAMGIPLTDTAGHRAAVPRNWEFFCAPLAGIVCMHRNLGPADAVGVGPPARPAAAAGDPRRLGQQPGWLSRAERRKPRPSRHRRLVGLSRTRRRRLRPPADPARPVLGRRRAPPAGHPPGLRARQALALGHPPWCGQRQAPASLSRRVRIPLQPPDRQEHRPPLRPPDRAGRPHPTDHLPRHHPRQRLNVSDSHLKSLPGL